MEKHLPDLPTVPMPAAKPPQKGRKRGRVLALVSGGILLLCLSVGLASILLRVPPSQTGHAQNRGSTQTVLQGTQAANSSPPALQGTQTRTTSTSTPAPGAPPQTGQPSITHGRPHLGGPFSDFVGKYGSPDEQGETNSQNFWVGTDQTIDINVSSNAQGEVTQIDTLGPPSWNAQQAERYCTQFLPDQATQVAATATQIEYQSSSGEVILTEQTQSCLLTFART